MCVCAFSPLNTCPSGKTKSKKQKTPKNLPRDDQHTIAQNIFVAGTKISKADTPIPMVAQRHFHCSNFFPDDMMMRFEMMSVTYAVKWGYLFRDEGKLQNWEIGKLEN